VSQVKDEFALNCGFQHQGEATSTAASALLETIFQFPFTHPDSSFLEVFLEKLLPMVIDEGGILLDKKSLSV
jgi:hypothetical protein